MLIDNDWEAALPLLQQAVAADPTFTLAQHTLASLMIFSNRNAEAVAPMRGAQRASIACRSERSSPSKRTLRHHAGTSTRPGPSSRCGQNSIRRLLGSQNLYDVQNIRNRRVEAIATLEKIYAIRLRHGRRAEADRALPELLGNFAEARDALRRYVERFPDDYAAVEPRGIELNMGDLDAARRTLEKACCSTHEHGAHDQIDRLSSIKRVGKFAAAESAFGPRSRGGFGAAHGQTLGALHVYYRIQANTAALDALAKRIEETGNFPPPITARRPQAHQPEA